LPEASFTTSVRPILVNVTEGEPRVRSAGQHDRLSVSVPLRNVGGGLALIEAPSLEITSTKYQRMVGGTRASTIPATEQETFLFVLECDSQVTQRELEQEIRQNGFCVVARYRDLDGEQPGRTRAKCEHLPEVGWRVTTIELFRGEEREPFAVLPGQSVSRRLSD
jgi:hypothetical protein